MKNSIGIGLMLLIGVLLACNSSEAPTSRNEAPHFFDLKAYFAEELKDLAKISGSIAKTTQIDGVAETHTFDSLNFAQELQVFMDSDINRLAWQDQYRVDSIWAADGSLQVLKYEALKPDLKTRKLRVEFAQNKAQRIQIENLAENALMNAAMQMEYRSGKGYRIQSNQKLRIAEEREMVVEVTLP